MIIYNVTNTVSLPISREEAWKFLANPRQLENITPNWFGLKTIDPLPGEMYEGLTLRYQIKPFFVIRINWVAEITKIEPGKMFIDEQRSGPFTYWQHEHRLMERQNGSEMQDIIHYALPFSILGSVAHRVFVRRMIEGMFSYRNKQIRRYFE